MANKSEIWIATAVLLSALGCTEPGGARQAGAAGHAGSAMMPRDASAGAGGTPEAPGDGGPPASDAAVAGALPALPFDCARDTWALNAADVGEVTLNVACRADEARDAPLAILLHGFPELHLAW